LLVRTKCGARCREPASRRVPGVKLPWKFFAKMWRTPANAGLLVYVRVHSPAEQLNHHTGVLSVKCRHGMPRMQTSMQRACIRAFGRLTNNRANDERPQQYSMMSRDVCMYVHNIIMNVCCMFTLRTAAAGEAAKTKMWRTPANAGLLVYVRVHSPAEQLNHHTGVLSVKCRHGMPRMQTSMQRACIRAFV
jgi:hypothetical protein